MTPNQVNVSWQESISFTILEIFLSRFNIEASFFKRPKILVPNRFSKNIVYKTYLLKDLIYFENLAV